MFSRDLAQATLMQPLVQRVEIVLTAHPTQVNRRTLQYKHTRIATLLAQNDRWAHTPIAIFPADTPLAG